MATSVACRSRIVTTRTRENIPVKCWARILRPICLWNVSVSFPASGDFCHLLIIFANSLDPDQDRQNVGPDLDPNRLTL